MTISLFEGLPVLQQCHPEYQTTGLVQDIFFSPDNIVAAVQRLLAAEYHLEDLSGLDTAEGIVINYHFDHFETPGRIVLRVLIHRDALRAPSIAGVYSGAEWHERELSDFYGVTFDGNPNPVPLLLLEDNTTAPLVKSEKTRVPICGLIKFDAIAHRDAAFERLLLPANPEPQNEEAPN
jgi:NADH-quinone oxidoreductase subunit C